MSKFKIKRKDTRVEGTSDDDVYIVDLSKLGTTEIVDGGGTDTIRFVGEPWATANEFLFEDGQMVWRTSDGGALRWDVSGGAQGIE